MKPQKPIFSLLLLAVMLMTSGCASYPTFQGVLGIEVNDLIKAKKDGKSMVVAMPKKEVFDKVLEILNANVLTVFQVNRGKGYIVAMGFPKQTNTTRVGIFFEEEDAANTLVTLSSLSSTALDTAEGIIFTELRK